MNNDNITIGSTTINKNNPRLNDFINAVRADSRLILLAVRSCPYKAAVVVVIQGPLSVVAEIKAEIWGGASNEK